MYRTVDKEGNTVDFMLSEPRDEPVARAFFEKAIGSSGIPDKITMDKSGANKAGIDTINLQLALLFMLGGLFLQLTVRQIKYLNNIVEQDHRFIKKITKPMKGFKAFHSADATLAGTELHYSASIDERGRTRTLSYNGKIYLRPTLFADRKLHPPIKLMYNLNDEQLKNISLQLEKELIELMQRIFNTMLPTPYDQLFNSHQQLDKDLLFLLQTTESDTITSENLLKEINELQKYPPPNFHSFEPDVKGHMAKASNLIAIFLNSEKFHQNLLKIYLHLVFLESHPELKPSLWSHYKKQVVQAIGVTFKLPVPLLNLLSISLLACFFLAPLFIFSSELVAWGAVLGWSMLLVGLIVKFKEPIGRFGNTIGKAVVNYAQFVDSRLEYCFGVKFYATQLSSWMHELQEFMDNESKNTATLTP